MTGRLDGQEKRRCRASALVVAAVLGIAGCTTTSLEDVAPEAATIDETAQSQTAAIPAPTAPPNAGEPVSNEALPEAAGTTAVAATQAEISGEAQGSGRNTGQFPNLNIPPVAAAPQLTSAERQAKLAELAAARQAAQSGASVKPAANQAELKKLARTHAQEALEQIEGE